jgi:hypothetical protein
MPAYFCLEGKHVGKLHQTSDPTVIEPPESALPIAIDQALEIGQQTVLNGRLHVGGRSDPARLSSGVVLRLGAQHVVGARDVVASSGTRRLAR